MPGEKKESKDTAPLSTIAAASVALAATASVGTTDEEKKPEEKPGGDVPEKDTPRPPRRRASMLRHGVPVLFAFASGENVVERLAFIGDVDEETGAVDLVVMINGPKDRELLEPHERSFAHVSPLHVWRKAVLQNEGLEPKPGTWRDDRGF